jgi:DNA-binding response OmpR family regulator
MTPSALNEIHNILLIQGDGQDAQSVRDALANGSDRAFRVEWVKSCALGLERLAAPPPHDRDGPIAISAILVDLMLPDLPGLGSVDRLVNRGGPTNLDGFRGRDKWNSAGYAAAASG